MDLVAYMKFGHCKMKHLSGVRLLIVLSSADVMGGTWVHRYELCMIMLFAMSLCQGQGKVSLQMEQPVSGVTACGDTPHHQLFASCRVHAVTWHTSATPGL